MVEHLNRWSPCNVFLWRLSLFPPTSTSHPPDIVHVMNAPRPTPFFFVCFAGLPRLCIIAITNRIKKEGRPENKATKLHAMINKISMDFNLRHVHKKITILYEHSGVTRIIRVKGRRRSRL